MTGEMTKQYDSTTADSPLYIYVAYLLGNRNVNYKSSVSLLVDLPSDLNPITI